MMEVRSSVTALTVLLALFSAIATGDDYVPAKLYMDSEPGPPFNVEDVATEKDVDSDVDHLLMTVIARLMKNIKPENLDKDTTHRLLAAISGLSVPQQTTLTEALLDGAEDDHTTADTADSDYDKRSRCRGGRQCRNVGGLNPNANLRPLPFGKRSRYSGASQQQASSSSSSLSDFSNKRGRVIKNRLRERVRPFLPFGRR